MDKEAELRALWTEQGVSKAEQDAMIADITAKAQPGARVGPFTIRKPRDEDAEREAFAEYRAAFGRRESPRAAECGDGISPAFSRLLERLSAARGVDYGIPHKED